MEQTELFNTPEEEAYEAVRTLLENTLCQNGLDESYISLQKNKSDYSILFNGTSVIAKLSGKKKRYISFPSSFFLATESSKVLNFVESGPFYRKELKSFDEVSQYCTPLYEVLQKIIESIPKEFDCCSRYLSCSEEKTCVHPDRMTALKCGYRKILSEGKVFYGKNRNID